MKLGRVLLFSISFLFVSVSAHAQVTGQNNLIDPARATDWTKAGVLIGGVGGVPATWPQCTGYVGYPSVLPTTSTQAQINAALAACGGTSTYVPLAEGNFNFTGSTAIVFPSTGNVILRGAGGGGKTNFIFPSDAPPQCGQGPANICLGAASFPSPVNAATKQWVQGSTGYAQGISTITLSDVSGIHVGDVMNLDECTTGMSGNSPTGCAPASGSNEVDNGNFFNCEYQYTLPWSSTVDYNKNGAFVVYSGFVYQSINDGSNLNLQPNLNPSRWSKLEATSNTVFGCTFNGTDSGNERKARGHAEAFVVTAVDSTRNQVTFQGSLRYPDWSSARSPEAWFYTPLNQVGLEDINIDNTATAGTCSAGRTCTDVTLNGTVNSWVQGVRVLKPGYAGFILFAGVHNTFQFNYCWFDSGNGNIDNDCFEAAFSGDNLWQSNIFTGQRLGWMFDGSDSGSVLAYNFNVNDYNGNGGMGQFGSQHGLSAFMLLEGNIAGVYLGDFSHGSKQLNTVYRNFFTGWESCGNNMCNGPYGAATSQWDPATSYPSNAVVSYPSTTSGFLYFSAHGGNLNKNPAGTLGTDWAYFNKNSGTAALVINAYNRNSNIYYNVLGTPGYHSNYNTSGNKRVIVMGGGNTSTTNKAPIPTDTLVAPGHTTTMWGNYDVVSGIRWCGDNNDTGWVGTCGSATELATTSPYLQAKPTVGDTGGVAPASLYLSSKPAWFGSIAWPPIGPDVTLGNVGQCTGPTTNTYGQRDALGQSNGTAALTNGQCAGASGSGVLTSSQWGGHVNASPAMACFLNVMGGRPDGSDLGPLSFNRNTCYGPQSPVVNTSTLSQRNSNTATVNFSAPSGGFGIRVAIFIATTATLSSIQDCPGSSPCTSTSDSFSPAIPANPCGVSLGTFCEYFICQSTLSAGANSVTVTMSANNALYVEVDTLTSLATSGCLDQARYVGATVGANPSISTTSNIAPPNELVLSSLADSVAPSAGSGYTQRVLNAGFIGESSNTPPAVGAPATAPYLASSGTWKGIISTWKSY